MEVRDARNDDATEIEAIVREVLVDVDGIDDEALDGYVETAYGTDGPAASGDPSDVVLVAADDDGLVGAVHARLAQGESVTGDVRRLHVRSGERGRTAAVRLLGEAVDRLADDGATVVRARVLASTEASAAVEARAFEHVGTTEIKVADTTVAADVYETRLDDGDGRLVEPIEGLDRDVFADFAAAETGTEAPLYPVYESRSRDEHYGWLCGNCDSLATSMDAAGRIACEVCGNRRTATEWDGSYL